MTHAPTRVDVANDSRLWSWAMPSALRMTREAAVGWYQSLCDRLRKESERIEAAYLGAERGTYPHAQRRMAECFDAGELLPDDPTVLALAAAALEDETLQWHRMFWAVHGPATTLAAARLAPRLRWTRHDEQSWASVRKPREAFPSEIDFLRGLVNSLPPDEKGVLREKEIAASADSDWAALEFAMQVFPGPDWVERLAAQESVAPRAWAHLATMMPSHNEAADYLERALPLDLRDVGEIVVNLLRNHGHGKTMRILEHLVEAQPDLLGPLLEAFEDTCISVASCAIAAKDLDVGRDYLRAHPQHAIAALESVESPTDSQSALLLELRQLPSPTETAETVSYWPLGWAVVDESVVAAGPGALGEYGEVDIEVRIHPSLVAQLDEDDAIAALDLLQPDQRETLQFVVAQWSTIALVASPLLNDNGARPLKVVIGYEDAPMEYGIAATSETDTEHGLGVKMKALAVAEVGGMALVL